MKLKTLFLSACLALGFTISGCDSALERVEPFQQVSPEQLLPNQAGFEALLASAYDRLQDVGHYGQFFMLYPDALADNIVQQPQSSNRYPGVVRNGIGNHLNLWGGAYAGINDANIILARLGDLTVTDLVDPSQSAQIDDIRGQLEAEARFLRALNYFDLIRTKAYEPGEEVGGFSEGVVLRTDGTFQVEDAEPLPRSSNTEVYQFIVDDLRAAAAAVASPGILTGSRQTINFANEAAIQGLLARAELYRKQWSQAEAAATAAIAAGPSLVVDTGNGELLAAWMLADHPESLFELEMTAAQDGAATNSNQSLQSLTSPRTSLGGSNTSTSFFDAAATADLVNEQIAQGGARLDLYGAYTSGGQPVYFINKYTGTTAQYVDRVPVMRVAEMYLIRAEARMEQGDLSGALSDLNTLRNARNLSDLDASVDTASEILDAVYLERRLELAFEGHRFFDLKRRGMNIPKPQPVGFDVLPYTDFRILAQIPQTEVESNPLLVQNPGY